MLKLIGQEVQVLVKTLEDLLGITENNVHGPNATIIKLKSARKNV